MTDHLAADYAAAMRLAGEPHLRVVPDAKEAFRQSLILAALENIIKFDDEPCLRASCRARYLELTDGRLPK